MFRTVDTGWSVQRRREPAARRSAAARQAAAVVALVLGGLTLAGCASRPEAAELSESILNASEQDPSVELTDDEATCIAQRLIDGDLSDTTLDGLVQNFNEPEVLAAEADDVTPAVAEAAEACVGQG